MKRNLTTNFNINYNLIIIAHPKTDFHLHIGKSINK